MDARSDWQRRMGVGERQSRYDRVAGTVKTEVVPREDNGKPAGSQVYHWDGRVDANITPATVYPNREGKG